MTDIDSKYAPSKPAKWGWVCAHPRLGFTATSVSEVLAKLEMAYLTGFKSLPRVIEYKDTFIAVHRDYDALESSENGRMYPSLCAEYQKLQK